MREVNVETLLGAVQDGKPWLARFTGKEYGRALQDYRDQYGPLFREAALADGEEAALADVLLDGLAEGWNRQMLVCFLSPMLLEDPVCAPLAERLQAGWAARWPKDAYQVAPAERLQKGFRASIFGIPLPNWREEEDG